MRVFLLTAAVWLLSSMAQAAPAVSRSQLFEFDVPAGPLEPALQQVAEVTGLQIAVPASLGHTQRVSAVRGRMTWETALRRMLVGTDVAWRIDGHGRLLVTAPGGLGAR